MVLGSVQLLAHWLVAHMLAKRWLVRLWADALAKRLSVLPLLVLESRGSVKHGHGTELKHIRLRGVGQSQRECVNLYERTTW